jgi:Transposase DDE domain group 1
VRISRSRIRARVKGDLPIKFSDEKISAHGGLELMRRYLAAIDLPERLRALFRDTALDGDFGAARIAMLLIGLLVIGGLRVTHLAFVGTDPVLLRFAGLHLVPTDRTGVRWLKAFTPPLLERLGDLIRDLVYEQIERCRLARVTIDLDGTVLRTGAKVDGAERGYNPHHPKDPSYYPLTAHLAQLGQILRVWNRPGNVHDSHNAAGFLRVLFADLRARFGHRLFLELRMDGAFFHPEIFAFLDGERVEYAVKVPMWKWLGLLPVIASRRRWTRVDAYVEGFATTLHIDRWGRTERVVVYRKRVSHESRKNFQLDLFSPDDGHYEYSAVATNKTLAIRTLWHFMAGRGAHEKTLAELKSQVAFEAIPTNDRYANAAWQLLSALTLNLVRSFQIETGAARRPRTLKRTFDYVFQSLATMRFELIHQPLRLARPAGRPQLRFAVSPRVQDLIRRCDRAVQRLAA